MTRCLCGQTTSDRPRCAVERCVWTLLAALLALALWAGAREVRGGDRAQTHRIRNSPPKATVAQSDSATSFESCTSAFCVPQAGNLWVRGEYLLWWTDESEVPALVTTGPPQPEDMAGVLDQNGTEILFGGDSLLDGARPGGRVTLGWWFDPCETAGIEASYLRLGDRQAGFSATSATIPVLARPYFDLRTPAQDAILVAHPDFLVGSIDAELETSFQGGTVTWRQGLYRHCQQRADLLVGYRFAQLDDRLRIAHDSRFTAPRGQTVVGTTRSVLDSFDAQNNFHGGEIGLALYHDVGCWSWDVLLKVALGGTVSDVDIAGRTVTTVPNAGSAEFVGGLLAQPTNIGRHGNDQFAVIPELGVKVGYDLTCNLRATLGYNLIAWTKVLRAAEQVDVSVSQLPPEPPAGTRHPQFPGSTSTFWAQGLVFGLECVW